MIIKKIKIKNFRNYAEHTFIPERNLNIIYGENAQGKTNLLESCFYLLSSVSYRTRKEKEIIKWGEEGFLIKGEVGLADGRKELLDVVYINDGNRKSLVNGIKLRKEEYFAHFPLVIFIPQDILLITGAPVERRKFLNDGISRISPAYYHHLLNYYRVVKQRNMVLKTNPKNISVWDDLFIKHGAEIIKWRLTYLDMLEKHANKYHRVFSHDKEDLQINHYHEYYRVLSGLSNKEERVSAIRELLSSKIITHRDREIEKGYTMVGPHKDDIIIKINDKEVKSYSSQGQQRTTVISIRMAQAEILKEIRKEQPVLLMDDCFSELDVVRTEGVLRFISNEEYQCMVTTYEKIKISSNFNPGYFCVSQGSISNG